MPLAAALEREGFVVEAVASGDQILRRYHRARRALVLVAVDLPALSGFDICRRLRAESNVPIIMTTGSEDDTDVVVALDLGADDCIRKPFRPQEVVARVRAALRRSPTGVEDEVEGVLEVGDVRFRHSSPASPARSSSSRTSWPEWAIRRGRRLAASLSMGRFSARIVPVRNRTCHRPLSAELCCHSSVTKR